MREWLRETHGPGFELLRHFLRRFFDSELVTIPGHAGARLVWVFAFVAPWFLIFTDALAGKYRFFSGRAVAGPYRQALRADELWLLTLTMSAIGLLAAVKWQSLFPGLRDYQALGSLPLRTRQIFAAKLGALLLITTAAVVTLNGLPMLLFPAVSGGRWAIEPSLLARIGAHGAASAAGCYFFFFAFVSLQGVLLNALCPRAFGRISGTVQGLAVASMLILMVLSFSIGPPAMKAIEASQAAQWFPPVWFVGLYQTLMGDPDPLMHLLAGRATAGLEIALVVALASYLLSYRRHREFMVEGATGPAHDRHWPAVVLEWCVPNPRQQAVIAFLWKTLGRSSHHRMILMGYGGFGVAVVATGLLGIGSLWGSAKGLVACFIYMHVILLLFLLLGLRRLFSIPSELRANWTFQITEAEGRDAWLEAVDRFVLLLGAGLVLLIPLPFEVILLGWRALGEVVLFVALGLLGYEWLFAEWQKLPFTCSDLPGKQPLWITALYFIGLFTALPILNALLLLSLFSGAGFTIVLGITIVAWRRIHTARREAWGELRLKYDETPDPAIHSLGLGQ